MVLSTVIVAPMELSSMMCLRDRSYCSSKDCTNKGCTRRITEELRDEAVTLGIPVCYTDLQRVCSAYSNKTDEECVWQN